jgi:hypothetical protein
MNGRILRKIIRKSSITPKITADYPIMGIATGVKWISPNITPGK